eukprot:9104281-Prorocentrum_lima.AAC.1
MTSSLVGSEMCIRDSSLSTCERLTCTPTSTRTYTLPSRRRYPSQGCAPSCGAACTALARPRRAGRH